MAQCAAAAASSAALCTAPGVARAVQSVNATPAIYRAPVVSFHVERPYVDLTGRAMPYRPPNGTRSGQPIAELSEEEYLRRHPYL